MDFEVLYTSEAIRQSVYELFSGNAGRRVAVVAFVGNGAEAYLPTAKGIELYCWPSIPGTNPKAIRKLAKTLHVNVHFAPNVHMKLYWSEKKGAIITSANLSSNAYGHGGLKELGVRLPPGAVDINRILESIHGAPLTDAALEQFEKSYAKHAKSVQRIAARHEGTSFADWYRSRPAESAWKVCGWEDEDINVSKALRHAAGLDTVEECMALATQHEAHVNDYLLSLDVTNPKRAVVEWFFVTHVVKVPKADQTYYPRFPFQVWQAGPLRMYRRPPFEMDKPFQAAIKAVVKSLSENETEVELGILKVRKPSTWLLDSLYEHYEAATSRAPTVKGAPKRRRT